MEDTAASFGQWLRHRRRELDLTQDALARRVGCARITLRKIEADQLRPSKQMAERLCGLLGVPSQEREAFVRFARAGIWAASPATNPPNHNLPLQLTSFVGRQPQMAQVRRLLEAHRLVTLTGSGGVGKTRLALQVAAEITDQFKHGVWFVDLAPVVDGGLIAQVLLRILGLAVRSGQQPVQMLVEHLADKSILILLDNCEHLLADSRSLAQAILQAGSGVRVLATSREALDLPGEQLYRVPSLAAPDIGHVPSPEELVGIEAVQLFCERAALFLPDFAITAGNAAAVVQLCTHLDGIPLAIELAAARLRSMPLEMLVLRLDDRFRLLTTGPRTALPRYQTLRAMIDWSYDLLSGSEQLMLQRLSVFRGGRSLEAAQVVCIGEGIEHADVLELLSRLVDKSLLSLDERGRYRMLETVRQYGGEKLIESGQAEQTRDRHLQYMLDLAEQAGPQIRGSNQVIWLERLDAELDNLRAALTRAQERNAEYFLRLASALCRYWDLRSMVAEGMDWLKKALAMTEGLHTVVRARALAHLAEFYVNYMDVRMVRQIGNQAYALAAHLEDEQSMASALTALEYTEFYAESPLPISPAEQALSLARGVGDHWMAANGLWMLGQHARYRNDLALARSLFDQSLQESRLSGDRRKIAGALMELANLSVAQGDGQLAESLLQEALDMAREIRDAGNIMECQLYRASAAMVREDYARAKKLADDCYQLANAHSMHAHTMYALIDSGLVEWAFGNISAFCNLALAALVPARRVNDPILEATALCRLADAYRLKGDEQASRDHYAHALALSREEHFKEGYCHCLQGFGSLALSQGHAARAVRLFAARAKVRERVLAEDFYPLMIREREKLLAEARTQLGDKAFDAAWTAGQAMSDEEMLSFALEAE